MPMINGASTTNIPNNIEIDPAVDKPGWIKITIIQGENANRYITFARASDLITAVSQAVATLL